MKKWIVQRMMILASMDNRQMMHAFSPIQFACILGMTSIPSQSWGERQGVVWFWIVRVQALCVVVVGLMIMLQVWMKKTELMLRKLQV